MKKLFCILLMLFACLTPVYADSVKTVKYAVAVWDIGHDVDSNGKTMGLTFGPATGADYINSYKSHSPSGTTSAGHAHRCVHNDSWSTIILWNNTDPYVYEQCISQGCTHSVSLNLNSTLANTSFTQSSSGDGPTVLFHELSAGNNYQNLRFQVVGGSSIYGYGNMEGGWGGSRLRAMLNGADSLTKTGSYATLLSSGTSLRYNSPTQPNTIYNASNSLLSCFPSELQAAIGAKKVVSNLAVSSYSMQTTYDKLWIPSIREIADSTPAYRDSEGSEYARFVGKGGYTTSSSFRNLYNQYYNNDVNGLGSNAYTRSRYNGTEADWDQCRMIYFNEGRLSDKGAAGINPMGVMVCFSLRKDEISTSLSIPAAVNLTDGTLLSGSYSIRNGYANISVSSQNGYKLKQLDDEISYTVSNTNWNLISGSGNLNITIATNNSAMPKYAGDYEDKLVFTVSK